MSFFARLVGKKQTDGDDTNANKDKQAQQQQTQKQQGEEADKNETTQSSVAPRAIGGLPRINVTAGHAAAASAAQSAASTSAASSSVATAIPSNAGGATSLPLSAASVPGVPGVPGAGAAPPMPNMSSCCPAEKWRYESCFQKWYSAEYLTGKSTDLSGCQPMFDEYRSCVISYYEKNEPEFLLQAGTTSDHLLVEGGSQAFGTKYPNLDKDKKKDNK